jgi:hypothetical protein
VGAKRSRGIGYSVEEESAEPRRCAAALDEAGISPGDDMQRGASPQGNERSRGRLHACE